jgi:quercetin dioxygenase-like cupin family protein
MNRSDRRGSLRRVGQWGATTLLAAGIGIAVTHAQPPGASQPAAARAAPPSAANYHGVNTLMPTDDLAPGRRRFEPAAHAGWHIHQAGQLLYVEEGVGVVQRRGEPVKVLRKGEPDFTPAGVPHWHGAAPDQPAVMSMVIFGGIGPWLEPVTDTDYAERTKHLSSAVPSRRQPSGAAAATPAPAAGAQNYVGITSSVPSDDMQIARGRFEAGAHTNWHVHPKGQIIFAQEGSVFVQRRGEPVKVLKAGESDFTPPGVEHWHGAAPDAHAIKIVVGFGAPTQWLQSPTEAEHAAMIKAFK